MYQYFVNAIPTTYTDGKGNVTNTYQLDREIELRNRVTETHYLRPVCISFMSFLRYGPS